MPGVSRRGIGHCGAGDLRAIGGFQAWSYVDFGMAVWSIRSRPAGGSRRAVEERLGGRPSDAGDEEFKCCARTRGDTPSRSTEGALRGAGMLKRSSAPPLERAVADGRGCSRCRIALSTLCHWVRQAERCGQSYGLRLPRTRSSARGEITAPLLRGARPLRRERHERPRPSSTPRRENVRWRSPGWPSWWRQNCGLPDGSRSYRKVVVGGSAWMAWSRCAHRRARSCGPSPSPRRRHVPTYAACGGRKRARRPLIMRR